MNVYNLLMIVCFTIGYLLIALEHCTKINKTAVALLTAIACWFLQFMKNREFTDHNISFLSEHLANISEIIVFLMAALTIIAVINAHKGFALVSNAINVRSKRKLLWLIGLSSFFLSAVLDNLTTTIVMISLLSKLVSDADDRPLLGGAVVIAANAGGAWTPIGDITTTMLWIGGQISASNIMQKLFLPSLVCLLCALIYLSFYLRGNFPQILKNVDEEFEPGGLLILCLGVSSLIFIPIFKTLTGLPPFMGILLGLGLMWLITDIMHARFADRPHLRVPTIMREIDLSSVMFFLGILLAVDALYTAGCLACLAEWMSHTFANTDIIAVIIGIASAVIDNVPLVAATMGMYSLEQYPQDSNFWSLIAYCAGTGGSMLIIGSAAGIAYMGLERVSFFWYMRNVGAAASVGYFAGIAVFKLMNV